MSNQPGDVPAERPASGRGDGTAAGVGQVLRERREQLGWSLPEVAVWLKIRLAYLEGLESGQLSRLPGNAYALGFLRTYASTLGLDADELTRRFRVEMREVNRRPELSFPAPVPERGVPAGAIVLLGALVIVGAYIGWYELGSHERAQNHPIPPVPAAMLPGTVPKAAPSPQVATVMPNPNAASLPVPAPSSAPSSAPSPAPSNAAAPAPVTATAPTATVAAGSTPPSSGTAATPAASPSPAASVATSPVPAAASAPAAADDRIVVKATAQSWVQIRQDGKVAIDRVLKPGESVEVPAGGPATLTTGNAGGVELSLGSVTTAPLGRFGMIRRNIPLDPATVRDGSVVAASAPAATVSATRSDAPDATTSEGTSDADATPTVSHHAAPHPPRPAVDAAASDAATDALNAQQAKLHAPH